MKKIGLLSLFILVFPLQQLLANHVEAVFTVKRGYLLQLVIDGRLINLRPEPQVFVNESPGDHRVELRVFDPIGRIQITHHERIIVIPNSKNQFILRVDRYGRTQLAHAAQPTYPGISYDHDYSYQNGSYHYYPGDRYQQFDNDYYNDTYDRDRKHGNCCIDNSCHRHHARQLMTDQQYNSLLQTLKRQNFDKDKLRTAKHALQNKLVYAEDVKEIMLQLDFESNKLDFAKFAYIRVKDQDNFYKVYDALTFNWSIRELEEYINQVD